MTAPIQPPLAPSPSPAPWYAAAVNAAAAGPGPSAGYASIEPAYDALPAPEQTQARTYSLPAHAGKQAGTGAGGNGKGKGSGVFSTLTGMFTGGGGGGGGAASITAAAPSSKSLTSSSVAHPAAAPAAALEHHHHAHHAHPQQQHGQQHSPPRGFGPVHSGSYTGSHAHMHGRSAAGGGSMRRGHGGSPSASGGSWVIATPTATAATSAPAFEVADGSPGPSGSMHRGGSVRSPSGLGMSHGGLARAGPSGSHRTLSPTQTGAVGSSGSRLGGPTMQATAANAMRMQGAQATSTSMPVAWPSPFAGAISAATAALEHASSFAARRALDGAASATGAGGGHAAMGHTPGFGRRV